MPELPEVHTIACELDRKLKNRRIESVVVITPKIIGIGPAVLSPARKTPPSTVNRFKRLLKGQRFLSVKRRAKLLIFDLSGPWSILCHLKMTGQLIFEDRVLRKKTGGRYRLVNTPKAPLIQHPSKYTHVIFNFTDGSRLYFNDIRKFGYLKLVYDDEINNVKELQEFGPEPLDKKFTFLCFSTAVKKHRARKIKEVLMDQKVVAGIGNIYSDEILFHARVRPTRTVASLDKQELEGIYKAIKRVLLQGIKTKGSSVGDFIRTDGSWGQMGKYHFVYGRSRLPCKRCGVVIKSVKLHGRTGSFCPQCQR